MTHVTRATIIRDSILIAEAPAMLEALRDLLNDWDDMGCEHDETDTEEETARHRVACPGCRARAIIARLDGAA